MFGMSHRFRRLRMFGIACLMLVQAVFPCVSAAQVGQGGNGAGPVAGIINSMSGPVFMRSASGVVTPLKPGDSISRGSNVSTGAGGEVILLFVDGLHISLSENSSLNIVDYRFDVADSRLNRANFTIDSGAMRLVTGAMHLANPQALMIRGGEVVISVVSKDVTSFVVEVDAGIEPEVNVAVVIGQVLIRSLDGRDYSIAQDQFWRWRPRAVAVLPQPLVAAPARLQALARSPGAGEGAPLDVNAAAELAKLLANLPASAAGQLDAGEPTQRIAIAEVIFPAVTPGGGGGCFGSPC